jgi:hypothetical protein
MSQLTYQQILNKMNNVTPPNYIPVNNMQTFNYDVYSYYNQYCASPAVTQQRRIMRNYENNNKTIMESNNNPFINSKGKKFNFLYTYSQNYMIVQSHNSIDVYIQINKSWCKLKHYNNLNCNELKEFIKSIALRKEKN